MQANEGCKYWFSAYVSGEGPKVWHVEALKTSSDGYHRVKILSVNGVTPDPYPEEIKTKYPDCEERLFTGTPHWSEHEALTALSHQVYEKVGEHHCKAHHIAKEWDDFLRERLKKKEEEEKRKEAEQQTK